MDKSHIDLRKIKVRQLNDPEELRRWNDLVKEQHYLKSSIMVGEQIRYVAEHDGTWVACLGFSAATYKSSLRSEWTDWSPLQEKLRRHLVVQNARFLVLEGFNVPNLASRCLSLAGKRISNDWVNTYGHPVYLLETFVEADRPGSCYKACGWQELGETKGYRREVEGYRHHGIKKTYFVFPLRKDARTLLGSEKTPDDKSLSILDIRDLPLEGKNNLPGIQTIMEKHFPRKGIKLKTSEYPVGTIVALVLTGFTCGVEDAENISAWAKELDEKHKSILNCPYRSYRGSKGKFGYQTPSPNTIRLALQKFDPTTLEKAMSDWAKLCGINTENTILALDGKVLRGAQTEDERAPTHVTLYEVDSGTVVDQDLVPNKTSEVTVARYIFGRNDLSGSLITADAAHTNGKTAEEIQKKVETTYSP